MRQSIRRFGMITLLCAFFAPLAAQAVLYKEFPRPKKAQLRKAARHFDFDKDGRLNWHERGRLETYRMYGWELADTKHEKKYDLNQDGMLNPGEYKNFQENKKGPSVRKAL